MLTKLMTKHNNSRVFVGVLCYQHLGENKACHLQEVLDMGTGETKRCSYRSRYPLVITYSRIYANESVSVDETGTISVRRKGFRDSPRFVSNRDYVPGYVEESSKVSYAVVRQSAAIGSGGGSGNGQGGGYGEAHRTVGSAPQRG